MQGDFCLVHLLPWILVWLLFQSVNLANYLDQQPRQPQLKNMGKLVVFFVSHVDIVSIKNHITCQVLIPKPSVLNACLFWRRRVKSMFTNFHVLLFELQGCRDQNYFTNFMAVGTELKLLWSNILLTKGRRYVLYEKEKVYLSQVKAIL